MVAATVAPVEVQAIPGTDSELTRLTAKLGVHAGAEEYLRRLRWPDGVECPRCSTDRVGYLTDRRKHYCRDCGYQFRVTAGTVLHDSHVPATTWLLAVGLLLDAERGFPANQLHQAIGGSYKTAWFVEHRIRSAMAHALHNSETAAPVARASRDQSRPERDANLEGTGRAPDNILAGLRLIRSLAAGNYHRPSDDHISAYWAELRWRAQHAGKGDVFRKTIQALLRAEPLSYAELVGRNA